MSFPWIVSGLSLLVAIVSWIQARRAVRRVVELSQLQWELRYEISELRVQVQRLAGGPPATAPEPPERPAAAFVPLAALKR